MRKSPAKQIRESVFALLNGNTGGVPVFDEVVPKNLVEYPYIVLSKQESEQFPVKGCFMTTNTFQVDVVYKDVKTKSGIDDLCSSIIELIDVNLDLSPDFVNNWSELNREESFSDLTEEGTTLIRKEIEISYIVQQIN